MKKNKSKKEKIVIKIGKNIRKIRKGKGLSSDKLGKLIGKDGSFIRRLELGKVKNIPKEIEDIASILEVPISKIIGEAKESKEEILNDIAWEMTQLYLGNMKQKVSSETREKIYELTLYKLKQIEKDIEKLIKLCVD